MCCGVYWRRDRPIVELQGQWLGVAPGSSLDCGGVRVGSGENGSGFRVRVYSGFGGSRSSVLGFEAPKVKSCKL